VVRGPVSVCRFRTRAGRPACCSRRRSRAHGRFSSAPLTQSVHDVSRHLSPVPCSIRCVSEGGLDTMPYSLLRPIRRGDHSMSRRESVAIPCARWEPLNFGYRLRKSCAGARHGPESVLPAKMSRRDIETEFLTPGRRSALPRSVHSRSFATWRRATELRPWQPPWLQTCEIRQREPTRRQRPTSSE